MLLIHDKHTTLNYEDFIKAWHVPPMYDDPNDVDYLLQNNPLLSQLLSLENTVLRVFDFKAMKYIAIFGDSEKLTGWQNKDFLDEGLQFTFSKIPPPDLVAWNQVSKLMSDFVLSLDAEKTKKYRGIFDYNFTKADGSITRILQQSIPLLTDSEGNILYLLSLFSNIENLKREGKQHLRLTDGEQNLMYEFDAQKGTYNLLEPLSNRELEVIKLVNRGFSSEEIGHKLFISPHTVDTHRRRIIKKMNMNDTLEVINLLKIMHFI